ncbi:NEDD4-binding protein 1-like [Anthonomus grandis grandis]|uniref:NEDD4-binding protein 1-like n=1 Tax=Anthonomus grandis grandis TaxID=2921223 RepID=UPI002165AD9E|nr:NEDD4-binding protein 1-like [Anthonomus grandis grandis]
MEKQSRDSNSRDISRLDKSLLPSASEAPIRSPVQLPVSHEIAPKGSREHVARPQSAKASHSRRPSTPTTPHKEENPSKSRSKRKWDKDFSEADYQHKTKKSKNERAKSVGKCLHVSQESHKQKSSEISCKKDGNRRSNKELKIKFSKSKKNLDTKKKDLDAGIFKKEYNKKLDSLNKFGKNFYCTQTKPRQGLRPIYIDGSNIAFNHGQNERFSVKGLQMCIDYFRSRGHPVKAFVPHFRLRKGESTDPELLQKMVQQNLVVTTPTLYIQNQRRSPYDDWYIVQSAAANGGIIVSSDGFQDILKMNPNLRTVVEECRLVPTFVDDMLIFPVDPHGNRQNTLDQFLKF